MDDGKPTVPENIMDTLISSDYNSAHTSNFTPIRYTQCAVANLEHLEPFQPINYIRIVAFSPNSLRAFFYGETISIRYSTTIKPLPSYNSYVRVLSEPSNLITMIGNHHQLCACCRARIHARSPPRSIPPIETIANPGQCTATLHVLRNHYGNFCYQ